MVSDDAKGLLCWIDVNIPFYTTMSKLNIVNDDKEIASQLLGNNFDYFGFVDGVKSLQTKANLKMDRLSLVKSMLKLIEKHSRGKRKC